MELQITNTGSGIPEPAAEPGYGLTGMTERADLAGGTVTAGPFEGGFRVHLSLPCPPVNEEQAAGSPPRFPRR